MSVKNSTTRKGLGRGIDSLLPQDFDRSLLVNESERIQKVLINNLESNHDQPRKHFDDTALKELAESIKHHGILQPLIVTPTKESGHFMIIAGERRWRAARIAKLQSVPVIVHSAKELEQQEIALVENVQRVDLSPLEQAVSIERLHQVFNMSYGEIGKKLGKDGTTVTNIARLLKLPPDAAQALREKKIAEGHARGILALIDYPDKQAELLRSILKYGWSVRQVERFVIAHREGAKDNKEAHAFVKTETPATKRLSQQISAPVTIRRMAHGGKLEIGYKDEADLERIMKFLKTS